MGKKNKPFKMKQYKVPPEKFLVVVNPWGVYGNFDVADFNHVGAWFEVMLRDEYPNTRIRAIYYQRTHRNIIVELPKEVDDFEQYLGTHKYSEFFKNAGQSKEVSLIYEYKYATFGDPTEKTFAIGHPMYEGIPPDFPIKYPYPLSSPAPPPPMNVPYARAIRPEVNERLADQHRDRRMNPELDNFTTTTAAPESVHPGPSNDRLLRTENPPSVSQSAVPNDKGKGKEKEIPELSEGNFTPYVRPGYLNSTLSEKPNKAHEHKPPSFPAGKLDPYEEDNRAETLLRSKPPVDGDDAQKFLDSVLDFVKTEEHSELPLHDTKADYVPSAELLEALRMLPSDLVGSKMVKAEEIEPNIKDEPTDIDYQPSDDLLAAFATLPVDVTFPGQLKSENPVKQEPLEDDFRIKQEPLDFTDFEMSFHQQQQSKSNEANAFKSRSRTARGSSSSKREIKYEAERDPPKRMKLEQ